MKDMRCKEAEVNCKQPHCIADGTDSGQECQLYHKTIHRKQLGITFHILVSTDWRFDCPLHRLTTGHLSTGGDLRVPVSGGIAFRQNCEEGSCI